MKKKVQSLILILRNLSHNRRNCLSIYLKIHELHDKLCCGCCSYSTLLQWFLHCPFLGTPFPPNTTKRTNELWSELRQIGKAVPKYLMHTYTKLTTFLFQRLLRRRPIRAMYRSLEIWVWVKNQSVTSRETINQTEIYTMSILMWVILNLKLKR